MGINTLKCVSYFCAIISFLKRNGSCPLAPESARHVFPPLPPGQPLLIYNCSAEDRSLGAQDEAEADALDTKRQEADALDTKREKNVNKV